MSEPIPSSELPSDMLPVNDSWIVPATTRLQPKLSENATEIAESNRLVPDRKLWRLAWTAELKVTSTSLSLVYTECTVLKNVTDEQENVFKAV